MSTLIEARRSDGTLIGRCDETCYNAHGKHCTCICGGRNHGVRKNQAIRNNTLQAEQVALTIARKTDLEARVTRHVLDLQLELNLNP